MKRSLALVAMCLALAACDQQAAAPSKEGAAATGEVLPGSISDAMIPLEQLDSEAPLAPKQAVATGDVDAGQPEVEPVPGIDTAAPAADSETAPAQAAQPEE